MATFIFVHGALGGGWEWRGVARRLEAQGHVVFRPTLTGLGERAHLLTPQVGLDTHVQDILGVVHWEELDQFILCGHSYGGMVVTGVADAIAERISHLVYIDAFVPGDGQSANDLSSPGLVEALLRGPANDLGDGWRVPATSWPTLNGVADAVAEWYASMLTDHPLRCFEQPIRLSGSEATYRRTFIRCSPEPEQGVFGVFARRAQAEGWGYYVLPTEHDAQITDPDGLTRILDGVADSTVA